MEIDCPIIPSYAQDAADYQILAADEKRAKQSTLAPAFSPDKGIAEVGWGRPAEGWLVSPLRWDVRKLRFTLGLP